MGCFYVVDVMPKSGIIATDGEDMDLLPQHDEAVIPVDKFTKYCLNPDAQPDKASAFHQALGYDMTNYNRLISNIRRNLTEFSAIPKGHKGWGETYECIMNLRGPNGKNANILTAWVIRDGEDFPRLASAYVTNRKVR